MTTFWKTVMSFWGTGLKPSTLCWIIPYINFYHFLLLTLVCLKWGYNKQGYFLFCNVTTRAENVILMLRPLRSWHTSCRHIVFLSVNGKTSKKNMADRAVSVLGVKTFRFGYTRNRRVFFVGKRLNFKEKHGPSRSAMFFFWSFTVHRQKKKRTRRI